MTRYKVPTISEATKICLFLGTLGILCYGLGLILILIGFLLPATNKYYCGECLEEVEVETTRCPHCHAPFEDTIKLNRTKLNNLKRELKASC